jgi:hypothetical protein
MANEFEIALGQLSEARQALDRICATQDISAGALRVRVTVNKADAAKVADFLGNLETILRAALPAPPPPAQDVPPA